MSELYCLYHSGSGSTRMITGILCDPLADHFPIKHTSVNRVRDHAALAASDLLILAFPTYHCHPSDSMLRFVRTLPVREQPQRAFILTTCGWFRGNSIRILARELRKKNVLTVGHATIRGPASDGVVMSPIDFRILYRYGKDTAARLLRSHSEIDAILRKQSCGENAPAFSWYAPLNAPNKYLGMLTSHLLKQRIHVLKEQCINCGRCVAACERGCFSSADMTPVFSPGSCEFCLRCVHQCPQNAIVFSRRQVQQSRLTPEFYAQAETKIRTQLNKDVA
ncbi:MAG: EFR1 family ferrodoxin [candidate division KSB1 bacterium]|nr:EFR1 family ferrodoxin [candidate division KSB1 bacterium]